MPEQGRLTTTVMVGSGGARDARFDGWRAALPAPLGSPASFAWDGAKVRIGIPLPAAVQLDAPHLFLADDRVVDYAAPQAFFRQGDLLVVELDRAKIAPAQAPVAAPPIRTPSHMTPTAVSACTTGSHARIAKALSVPRISVEARMSQPIIGGLE